MAAKLVLRWLTCCTLGVLLALGATPVEAGTGRANMLVSATILKHARLRLLAQPASFVVTPTDIGRGYVEVVTPTELAIQSNSPDGYALEFAASSDVVRRITVLGLGGEVELSPAGGVVTRAPTTRGMSTVTLRLGFRFALDATAQPGTYAWPMQMSVMPL